jgi:hypothetical protein
MDVNHAPANPRLPGSGNSSSDFLDAVGQVVPAQAARLGEIVQAFF